MANKPTKFVGLINQGRTCHLNAVLQMLYSIPKFRNAVYDMPSEHSVAKELKQLFKELESSDHPVGTNGLTKCLGIDPFKTEDAMLIFRTILGHFQCEGELAIAVLTTAKNLLILFDYY